MILRAPMAFGAALLLTATLFYAMQLLIAVGEVPVFTDPAPEYIDTRIPEREIEKPTKRQRPDRIEAIEQPEIEFPKLTPLIPGDPIVTPRELPPSQEKPTIEAGYNRSAQPMVRIEPNFQNINQPEYVTLSFDVAPTGAVIRNSIEILDSSSRLLHRPAIRAVSRWKYQPKKVDGVAVVQRGIQVSFKVEPAQ
ncbi:MAG: TonB family protein [Pseudomonadota bacterium]